MEVFVDERSYGYVKSGGELTVSVAPGEHEIVVVGAGQSCGGIIDVGAGQNLQCQLSASKWNSKLQIEFV